MRETRISRVSKRILNVLSGVVYGKSNGVQIKKWRRRNDKRIREEKNNNKKEKKRHLNSINLQKDYILFRLQIKRNINSLY